MNSQRDFITDKLWNWVRPLPSSKDFLVFEPRGNDAFELVAGLLDEVLELPDPAEADAADA